MNSRNLLILISMAFLLVSSANSQVTFEWAKAMGAAGTEYGNDIAVDANGNVCTVGPYQSATVDFDPGPGVFNLTNGGNTATFIQKLDSNGNFIWAKKIENIAGFEVVAYSVEIDLSGAIYVTGQFNGTPDFNPGPGVFNLTNFSGAGYDMFILKLDSNGNFLWAKQLGGLDWDIVFNLSLDAAANIYVTGCFKGTCDFDPGPAVFNLTSAGDNDIFVAKFDVNGNFQWVKKVGGTASDKAISIFADNTGNVLITGEFLSPVVDFNPGVGVFNISNSGVYDAFVLKLDNAGNFQWAKKIGAAGSQAGRAITTDVNGNVLTCGFFQGTVDFDPGVNTSNLTAFGFSGIYNDIFVQKLDPSGNFLWAKQFGGANTSGSAWSLVTDPFGSVYLTGNFNGVMDFDPSNGVYNLNAGNDSKQFTLKLNSSGDLVWVIDLISSVQSFGYSVDMSNSGSIYTTGYFIGLTDFDPGAGIFNLSSAGGGTFDIYIQKVSKCVLSSNITSNTCTSYTLNGQTYTQSGTYTQLFTNAQGCDSTLTLNLTVNQPTSSAQTQTACASYTLNGQTYTQSGVYTQQLTNAQGCDSTITLNLTITQPSSSAINQTSCSSYTLNNQTYTQSGIYTQQITNAQGCDSTITLNLTITQPTSSAISQTSCSSYTLNNQTYTQSGVYTQQLTNALGCDSTIILNLTILPMPSIDLTLTSGVLAANQQNASYQWLDCNNNYNPISGANQNTFSPIVSGNYTVQISLNNCVDTSACTFVQVGSSGFLENFIQTDKIYPNPNNGSFIFESVLGGFYLVTDLEGRIVNKFQIDKSEKSFLDFDLLSKGVYFITKENESNNSLKLIIH
ncbi:MAG: T9SS C-terminal target domain-containing protein [Flavobacteriia bacterium]|nr:T9SS C-terminal target domain-containing protein [Flavobacteriia bacterium]